MHDNTWHPRAALRNPRTVGDAGAAPVTIIRTRPPRLPCGREKNLTRLVMPETVLTQSQHSTFTPYLDARARIRQKAIFQMANCVSLLSCAF
jgi:hypothetical protein